jgi:hypothetical protein
MVRADRFPRDPGGPTGRRKQWGLATVHVETYPFGRGWQNQHIAASAVTPRIYPLIAYPKAWTPGTRGPVTGEAVLVSIRSEADFATYRGKLRGKFVLASASRDVQPRFSPQAERYTDSQLDELAKQPIPGAVRAVRRIRRRRRSLARHRSSGSMKA